MSRTIAIWAGIFLILNVAAISLWIFNHRKGVERATEAWQAHRPDPVTGIGATRQLTILPLVDWHSGRDDLKTAMGVSYLVKTDDQTILFDTGNTTKDDQSALEHNMRVLDVTLEDIDAVVISHAHFDHTGGKRWTDGAIAGTTFGVGSSQPDLSGKRVLTPIKMTYPGIVPEVGTDPRILGNGIATTGTIPRLLFVGWVNEQALAINVEGKGIVLVVGSGHQTLTRLIERTESTFDQPIYGVVGGLNYPVPEGRSNTLGLNAQRIFASGNGPLDPLSLDEIEADFALLEERDIGILGIGGHDSSDQIIEDAARRFGAAYRHVRVGEAIVITP